MAEREATTGGSGGDGSAGRDENAAGHGDGSAGHGENAAGRAGSDGGHSSGPRQGGDLTAAKAARLGLRQIVELTGRHADGVTGVEPSDDGWIVDVEVVEDARVPSSTDILAIYQTELDHGGELTSYRRIKRYRRSQGDSDSGGESW